MFSFISWTKGDKRTSSLELRVSGGGTRRTTFCLRGGLRRFFHLAISGNWLCNTRIVFGVAVAVIIKREPSNPLSSPVDNSIAGLKACLDPLVKPQLATNRNIVKKLSNRLRHLKLEIEIVYCLDFCTRSIFLLKHFYKNVVYFLM